MTTVYTIEDLQKAVSISKNEGGTIGFVPTMGALHEGHISLVKKCCEQNNVCVVSIFVNPTQFNNQADLEKYPRTIKQDTNILEAAGAGIVFVPSVEEIYPEPDNRQFDFGQLDKVMEGKFRPGHFNGVAQVVSRLFGIVKPDKAYFGEKDFQQLAIIRQMVRQFNIPVEIVPMPIRREESGLAMSSRNQRLSENQKTEAINIYRVLSESRKLYNQKTVEEVRAKVIEDINKIDSLEVEYFEIVDGNTLQQISAWKDSNYIVGCITVFCGDVRLIDNIVYS
ncbi:pantoate--beta-alanine ligase [Dysgonomonas alginatilytica]|uniref:Pantothenate synthetase n=1 Tax=Dysgonomonas alginatilytica TaxID=1605892 RepID=A0A2V3PLC2_9BACT|nr:pantoate--beta-alanine ligase [Dysgonomonas alginatilytica]PXV60257.1 pantoate--beta-alanine ligase [Dysgonomonas alginatilytica]